MELWVITGGIGTGKSRFAHALTEHGSPSELLSFSADAAVHEAYLDEAIQAQIAFLAGLDPKVNDPTAFRAQVRDALRRQPDLRYALEAILHPLVWKRCELAVQTAKTERAKVLVAEVPLYYETGAALAADRVIVVAASRATQLHRLQVKRSLDERASQDMLAMQLPLEDKIERADQVVWNDGCIDALESQATLLLRQANLLHFVHGRSS
jgi:dephospho-CoA kinase